MVDHRGGLHGPGGVVTDDGVLVAAVRARANDIGDPCSVAHGTPMGLDDMGLIEAVDVQPGGRVHVSLRLTSPSCYMVGYFASELVTRVGELPGVSEVTVDSDLGLDWDPSMMSLDAIRRRHESLIARGLPPRVGLSDVEAS